MPEANVVLQMVKSLSGKEMETPLRLLGMPTTLAEIIVSARRVNGIFGIQHINTVWETEPFQLFVAEGAVAV